MSRQIAMNLGKRRTLAETVKARVRARVEHPFRIVKRVFGCDMVCYRTPILDKRGEGVPKSGVA